MADFLIALADFDRRRGWELLGHASLFAFITSSWRLTPAPTYWRVEAARAAPALPRPGRAAARGAALPDHPGRAGQGPDRGEPGRGAAPLPRHLLPRGEGAGRRAAAPGGSRHPDGHAGPSRSAASSEAALVAAPGPTASGPVTEARAPSTGVPPARTLGRFGRPKWSRPSRTQVAPRRDDVDPLTADLRRLSITVSRRFLQKLEAAREGLSHAIPGATTEQVLEAALDLLLEKQARARGQVKRPRTELVAAPRRPTPAMQVLDRAALR